jgi:hypothetical protein
MARQGHAFATAEEVRIVLQAEGDTLEDVPADGKTLGEIVTRGNIVMKEVKISFLSKVNFSSSPCSISMTWKRPRRLSGEATLGREILLSCTQMAL